MRIRLTSTAGTARLAGSAFLVGALMLGACSDSDDSDADDSDSSTSTMSVDEMEAADDAIETAELDEAENEAALEEEAAAEDLMAEDQMAGSSTTMGTVGVPSQEGSITIADYAAGTAVPPGGDEETLTQIIDLVGPDAEGYITSDEVVVQTTAAEAMTVCEYAAEVETSYVIVPIIEDGTAIDCGP